MSCGSTIEENLPAATTGIEVFEKFKAAIAAQEFEASDKLAEALRSLPAEQHRLLKLALEFAYEQGLADA